MRLWFVRRGVSPVVGVVLLIAISVVAVVGVWFWIGGYTGKPVVANVPYGSPALSVAVFNGSFAVVRNSGGVVADSPAFVYNGSGVLVGFLALNATPLQPGESGVISFVSSVDNLYAGEYVIVSDVYPMTKFVLPEDVLPPIYVVFFGGNNSNVYALYAKNGSQYWVYTADNDVPSTFVVKDGILYFTNVDGVTALNASNGSKLWNYSKYNSVVVSPFLDDEGRFYYTLRNDSSSYLAAALNASVNFSGADRQLWLFSDGLGGADDSIVVVNDTAYFGGLNSQNKVYALNASNGSLIWSFQMTSDTESSPLVYNDVVYIGSRDNNIYALNATNGTKLWNYSTALTQDRSYSVSSSPTMHDGVLFIGADNANSTLALNASTGEKIWNFTDPNRGLVISSPFYYNGMIFIGYDKGVLYVLNASNGAYLWNYSTGDSYLIESSPVVFDDVVYFGSNSGVFYAVNVTSHQQLWNLTTSNYVVSSPVLCNIRNWHCLYPTVTGMNNTAS